MPDKSLSIAAGVVKPFQTGQSKECQTDLIKAAARQDVDIHCPFEELAEGGPELGHQRRGEPDVSGDELWQNGQWYGVKGFFKLARIEGLQDAHPRAA